MPEKVAFAVYCILRPLDVAADVLGINYETHNALIQQFCKLCGPTEHPYTKFQQNLWPVIICAPNAFRFLMCCSISKP